LGVKREEIFFESFTTLSQEKTTGRTRMPLTQTGSSMTRMRSSLQRPSFLLDMVNTWAAYWEGGGSLVAEW